MRVGSAAVLVLALLSFGNTHAAYASGRNQLASASSSAPAIGLGVGQKAPAFSLTDQFGHQQSNESLKGAKGTVLLFFRSADW